MLHTVQKKRGSFSFEYIARLTYIRINYVGNIQYEYITWVTYIQINYVGYLRTDELCGLFKYK